MKDAEGHEMHGPKPWSRPYAPVMQVGRELKMVRFLDAVDPQVIADVAGPGAVVRATEHGLEVVVDPQR